MLTRLRTAGFKSLADVEVDLPSLTVLYGPNAAGKSNVLDALFLLKRLATERTLSEALGSEVRGYPVEQLTFPAGGLPELLRKKRGAFSLEADLDLHDGQKLRYRVEVEIEPRSGKANVADEYLARLSKTGEVRGNPPVEASEDKILVRRQDGHRPQHEPRHLSHTVLSDPRRGAPNFVWIEKARTEFQSVRTYYLDPRISMRQETPPREVSDIGTLGQHLAPFLYRLKHSEFGKNFAAVRRTLNAVIPSVEDFSVDLNEERGTLDLKIVQNGIPFSSRMVSEGTLRVLALIAIAVNPWPSSVIAFEEPENGVHLRRLELIADLLGAMALQRNRQVLVTTHSPHFCEHILRLEKENPNRVGLLIAKQVGGQTECRPFAAFGPLFERSEIRSQLVNPTEDAQDGWFQAMVLRGLVDG
ncbi:MAG: hypothetical protein DCC71_15125 [Proteobacteria bacterium]|nr:MAG: hypothetical protein DCC71_15125 [Pseudomonadota bacterium]